MKRALVSAIVCALVVSPCMAQEPPMKEPQPPAAEKPVEKGKDQPQDQPVRQTENLPSAESLFEKHIAAIGGMDALKGEKNRLVRASYVGPGRIVEGSLRVLRVAPNKFFQTLEIPGVISQEVWCNGEEGWMRDTNNGTHKLEGGALVEYKRQSDFLGEANYKVRYKEVKTIYGEKFAGVDAFAVKAVSSQGPERVIYFDAKQGLVIGIRVTGTGGPETDSVTTLSDYKDFNGIKHPTKLVTKIGSAAGGETVITIKKIDSNLSAMPSTEPPDEVRNVK